MSCPEAIHLSSVLLSSGVVQRFPGMSRVTIFAPCGTAASISSPSFSVILAMSAFLPRFPAGISFRIREQSFGKRLQYSLNPSLTQPGIFVPTAMRYIFISADRSSPFRRVKF